MERRGTVMSRRPGKSERSNSTETSRTSSARSRPSPAQARRSSTDTARPMAYAVKSNDSLSLPTYSVSEDEDGNLVNRELGVVWPDRPRSGRYSLKNYYHRKQKLLRQRRRLALREQRHRCRQVEMDVSTAEEPSLLLSRRPSLGRERLSSSVRNRSRSSSRSARPVAFVSKSDDDSVSPPSYSVSEDDDGNLVNRSLGVVWPDRPSFGRYSLKNYYRRQQKMARRERRRRERERRIAESPSSDMAQTSTRSCTGCSKPPSPPPFNEQTAIKPRYLGVQTATAMARKLRSTEFLLYHRQPEMVSGLSDLPLNLVLTLAYKTSRGDLRNYSLARSADNMWHVESGDRDAPTFASLKGLVSFYCIYGHLDPLSGSVDVFPWWLDE